MNSRYNWPDSCRMLASSIDTPACKDTLSYLLVLGIWCKLYKNQWTMKSRSHNPNSCWMLASFLNNICMKHYMTPSLIWTKIWALTNNLKNVNWPWNLGNSDLIFVACLPPLQVRLNLNQSQWTMKSWEHWPNFCCSLASSLKLHLQVHARLNINQSQWAVKSR